jgi:hypothetical protein
MSAYGTKRTSNCHPAMSAFGGKADIGPTRGIEEPSSRGPKAQ